MQNVTMLCVNHVVEFNSQNEMNDYEVLLNGKMCWSLVHPLGSQRTFNFFKINGWIDGVSGKKWKI